MKKNDLCPLCEKGRLDVDGSQPHHVSVGPHRTADRGIRKLRCGECGNSFASMKVVHAAEVRAAIFVLSSQKLDGTVVRDVRRILGLTQTELGQLLGRTTEHVCRMEKKSSVAPIHRQALLAFCERDARGEPLVGPAPSDEVQLASA